jgi:1-pyrroline-5-carboxylate dehydrogenase
MSNSIFQIPVPYNEPVKEHAPGSPERSALIGALRKLSTQQIEMPLIIGGEEVYTGNTGQAVMPHDHRHVLGTYHKAGEPEVLRAIEAAKAAAHDWSRMPWETRAAIFLKAADILTCRRRAQMNATAMLDLGKTVHQSEIDAVDELADYWRFNPYFMMQIMQPQPPSITSVWNMIEHRPLEGFVFAVTPFNFPASPATCPPRRP